MSLISWFTKPFRLSKEVTGVEKDGKVIYQVSRYHSIGGDFLIKDEKAQLTEDELKKLQSDIKDYNTLWWKYTDYISSNWGTSGYPTEKGFNKWLQRIYDNSKNTKEVSTSGN